MSQPLFSPYQYAPLPESGTWTRVLILHPGLFDDEISISVRQELVSNKCEYEALSYVWGNVEDSGSIIVDIESRLTVARNLLIALQYLRRPDQPRILWIDAICINQQDMDERSRQVTYMYEVYRHAKSVYVWLGLENENSDLGISHLDAIGSVLQPAWNGAFCVAPIDTNDEYARALADELQPLDLSEDAWRAIFALLNRPYFERLWIRQEVQPSNLAFDRLLMDRYDYFQSYNPDDTKATRPMSEPNSPSARIHCGAASMSWWNFRNAIICLWCKSTRWSLGPSSSFYQNSAASLRNRLALVESVTRVARFNWTNLASYLSRTRCTDVRDRIYAVATLAGTRDSRLVVTPDYKKTPMEVLSEFTLAHIDHFKTIDLLRQCFTDGATLPDHPSWVPNWSRETLCQLEINEGPNCWASSHLYADAMHRGEGILRVTGVFLDVIHTLWWPLSEIEGSSETGFAHKFWPAAASMLFRGHGPQEQYPLGGTNLQALLESATMRVFAEEVEPPLDFLPSRAISQRLMTLLVSGTPIKEAEGTMLNGFTITEADTRKFQEIVRRSSNNYGLMLTSNGYIGMAPQWARAGDKIAVLVGASVPFVLRPCPSTGAESTRYRIKAPCYISGFMDGEALLGPLPEDMNIISRGGQVFRKRLSGIGTYQNEDPRLEARISDQRFQEYRKTMACAGKPPPFKVDVVDLRKMGVEAELIDLK